MFMLLNGTSVLSKCIKVTKAEKVYIFFNSIGKVAYELLQGASIYTSVIITHPDLAVHAWKLSLDYVILVPRPSVYFGQRGSGNKNGIM